MEIEKKPNILGLKQFEFRVDSVTKARLAARARQAGTSLSEYVRGLIEHDLSRTPGRGNDATAALSSTCHRISDTLRAQLLEVSVLTGILVRAQLSQAVGEDEARRIEARAHRKAAELVKMLLGDPGADSELEPVSPLD